MRRAIVATLLGLTTLVGCGGEGTAPNTLTPVASVRMSATSATVAVQGTTQLVATPLDAQGGTISGRNVVWVSKASGVATVTQSGVVTGVSPGSAVIEASVEGKKGETTVTVTLTAGSNEIIRNGTVVLPAGSTLTVSMLQVQNPFGKVAVAANGSFSITAFLSGPHPAMVLSPTNNPVLLGWLDNQRTTLNARTTAEVLAFYDIGAHLFPVAARLFTMQELSTRPELNNLVAAITTALATNPANASLNVPAVHAARQNLQAQLLASVQSSRLSESRPLFNMTFDPLATKSGISPFEVDYNSLAIRNQFRRRVVALVDRVSYVDVNGVTQSSFAHIARKEIEPVFGVTTFTGLLTDVVVGNLAWAEIQSEPIATPVFPTDARSTTYRLTVLGTGDAPASARNQLTAFEQEELRTVVAKALFIDLVLPMVSNLILSGNVAGDKIDDILDSPQAATLISDAANLVFTTAPGSIDKAYAGDLHGAVQDIWIALLGSDVFQEKTFELVALIAFTLSSPESKLNFAEISEFGKEVLKFVGKVDMLMTATDACLQAYHSGISNGIEKWTFTALQTKVSIFPPTSVIGVSDVQLLKAVAHGLENLGDGVQLQYKWTTTGLHGKLYDANHPGGATQITSPFSDQVNYGPNAQSSGIDQVSLEITRFSAGSAPVVIGNSTATIEVKPFAIAISPQDVTLETGENQTFTVSVPPQLAGSASLTYRWSTTGDFGSFDRGVTSIEGSSNSATYSARSPTRGEDQVVVEVLATSNGQTASLGIDRALVHIERGPFTIEPASLATRTDSTIRFMARPHGDLPANPRYVWRFGDNTAPVTVNGDSVASHVFEDAGIYEVSAELLDATSGVRLAVAKSSVVAGNVFYVTANPVDVKVNTPVTLVARNRNTKTPAGLRYEWTFGDNTSANIQGDSASQHTWSASGTYSVLVIVKSSGGAEVGRASATVTVGPAEDVPVWRITRLTRESVTGQVPSEAMSQNPGLLTYGQYFRTRAVLDEVIANRKPAYVHALDGNTQVPDCLDFDFDGDRSETFAWPPWIWIQFPQEVPTVCGENDNVLGHYPGDEAFGVQGTSLAFGFDFVAFVNRFQNAGLPNTWDYQGGNPFATIVRGQGSGSLSGRHFPTASYDHAPLPHRAYVVHEITSQINGAAMTGQLKLVYRAFGGDTGDEVVATWTAVYSFDAVQGR